MKNPSLMYVYRLSHFLFVFYVALLVSLPYFRCCVAVFSPIFNGSQRCSCWIWSVSGFIRMSIHLVRKFSYILLFVHSNVHMYLYGCMHIYVIQDLRTLFIFLHAKADQWETKKLISVLYAAKSWPLRQATNIYASTVLVEAILKKCFPIR